MAYDVHPDGTVSHGRHFADMSSADATNGVPDGMKVDREGRVYCTSWWQIAVVAHGCDQNVGVGSASRSQYNGGRKSG